MTVSHHGPTAHIPTLAPRESMTQKLLRARIIPVRSFHLRSLPIAPSYLFYLSSLIYVLLSFFSLPPPPLFFFKADNGFGLEKFLLPHASFIEIQLTYNTVTLSYNVMA